jgi:hypothetical protein
VAEHERKTVPRGNVTASEPEIRVTEAAGIDLHDDVVGRGISDRYRLSFERLSRVRQDVSVDAHADCPGLFR